MVSVTVALTQRAAGGPNAARQFLHGTVAGLFGRMAFGTVFAAIVPVGAAWALGLGAAAAGATNLAFVRGLAQRRRRGFNRSSGAKGSKVMSQLPGPSSRNSVL